MYSGNFTALFDACVLYPPPLRDFVMRLSMTGLFRAKWTAHIHDEWIGNALRNNPELDREKLERTRRLMDGNAPDCLVTGYEPLIPSIVLPPAPVMDPQTATGPTGPAYGPRRKP